MILKARHHFFIYPFFIRYCRWKIRKHFSNVSISGDFQDRGLPILLICNHTGWWDGFWAAYLNFNRFQRLFHFMMLEVQLCKYWFFKYTGGYAITKNSRSIIESLEYTATLLNDKNNLVLMFPQGKMHSVYDTVFHFEKGIGKVLSLLASKPVHILFAANMIDYFSTPRPGLYIYFAEYTGNGFNHADLETCYNLFYQQCLNKQIKLGE
ncbi:MAG: 1-acyl-sn-glycerol-3-phosphate acyltransferase [Bacteroidales bacterium]|nr:1-acyl-sn-glycerol-3-phosphate acyltransferase [Bacteroidales bacterium]